MCSKGRKRGNKALFDALFAGTSRALGLTNELFVLGDSVVLTVLGQVAFMPVLVLAARLCPEARVPSLGLLPIAKNACGGQ